MRIIPCIRSDVKNESKGKVSGWVEYLEQHKVALESMH